jgi:hypothetical protein
MGTSSRGIPSCQETGIQVVTEKDLFSQIVEAVHKDLGHYRRKTTLDGVAERYIVATDIWRDGEKELEACVPCQLYKPTPAASTKQTAIIHLYESRNAFDTWGIDWVILSQRWNRETSTSQKTEMTIYILIKLNSQRTTIRAIQTIISK